MKSMFAYCLVMAFSFATHAQTSLEPFEKITVSGSVILTVEKGDSETLRIPGDRDEVKFKVDQGKLKITRSDFFDKMSKNPVEVKVTYKYLRSLRASEGAHVENEGKLESSALEMAFSTGAQGNLKIEAGSVEINVGEGAVLKISGKAGTLEALAATGGSLMAESLQGSRVYAKANTGGVMHVHAIESLEANASLGGTIMYQGNPGRVNISEKLGGKVSG